MVQFYFLSVQIKLFDSSVLNVWDESSVLFLKYVHSPVLFFAMM